MTETYLDSDVNKLVNSSTINKLLYNISKLEIGSYKNQFGIMVEVINAKNNYEVTITSENLEMSSYNRQYHISLKIDSNTTLYQSLENNIVHKFIYSEDNGHIYRMYDYGISKDNKDICMFDENTLINKIDNNCYLGYCFDNNKIYVYYKKYNVQTETEYVVGNKDFIKYEYNSTFVNTRDYYNKKLEECLDIFKQDVSNTRFKELAESLSVMPLNSNLNSEANDLKELANVYAKYKEKFNGLENADIIKHIYEFTNQIINNPIEARANIIKDYINTIDMNNPESLKRLKTDINSLIKFTNKISKKKRK